MTAKLVKHPRPYFWFSVDQMYHRATLRATLTVAFWKWRLLLF